MDPPAYTSTRAAVPHRSIQDLRSQILANGSIMKPRNNPERPSDDHLELVVAKVGGMGPPPGMSEKQAVAAAYNQQPQASSSSAGGKHYAILLQRSYTKKAVNIVVKGEPRDTVEEALEWLLEQTEVAIHDMVVKHGRSANDLECCVM
ncbi:hypothetical protein LTR36_001661 [Oleoguttula mirabilis]|uniref:Uncharacterized protein n=1 Tax=Oleoguttula mirabilis TaxID=1507867 RepID=A0AAV9JP45_9PEZI|nr:hypothetical protein LTR36_001661 [Oleoguttula mirabilis]